MKKWFGVRHIRWFFKNYRFNKWWNTQGRHLGCFPNQADLDYLNKVWDGEA